MLAREIMDNIRGLWDKCYAPTLAQEEALMQNRDRRTRPPEETKPREQRKKMEYSTVKDNGMKVLEWFMQNKGAEVRPGQIGKDIGMNYTAVGVAIRWLQANGYEINKRYKRGGMVLYTYKGEI